MVAYTPAAAAAEAGNIDAFIQFAIEQHPRGIYRNSDIEISPAARAQALRWSYTQHEKFMGLDLRPPV